MTPAQNWAPVPQCPNVTMCVGREAAELWARHCETAEYLVAVPYFDL